MVTLTLTQITEISILFVLYFKFPAFHKNFTTAPPGVYGKKWPFSNNVKIAMSYLWVRHRVIEDILIFQRLPVQ